MTAVRPVPIPVHERMVSLRNRKRYPRPEDSDPQEGMATRSWIEWLTNQSAIQASSPRRVSYVELQDKAASVAATDISDGGLEAGFYRVSYYATISQAATTSCSLVVALDWTDRSAVKTLTGTAVTTNSTATVQVGGGLIRIDSNSPVRYTTTYGSVGATPMQYDLVITLERLL